MTLQRTLYVGNRNASSWSMRAWLALREKGIAFEERLVDLREPGRVEAMRAVASLSPSSTVPVLVEGDLVIFDSLAIMDYANELEGPPLYPADARKRARARSLVAWMHSSLAELRRGMSFESTFYAERPMAPAAALREAEKVVLVWGGELARHGGAYLAGDFSLADIAFVPVVRRLTAYGVALDRDRRVAEWAERLMARPAVVEWMREAEALPPVTL